MDVLRIIAQNDSETISSDSDLDGLEADETGGKDDDDDDDDDDTEDDLDA